MDTKDIIHRLSVLDAKYHVVHNELSNNYHFDELRDVRINVFRHSALVIDSTYNILLVRFHHLFDDAWWILVNESRRMLLNKYAIEQVNLIYFILSSEVIS